MPQFGRSHRPAVHNPAIAGSSGSGDSNDTTARGSHEGPRLPRSRVLLEPCLQRGLRPPRRPLARAPRPRGLERSHRCRLRARRQLPRRRPQRERPLPLGNVGHRAALHRIPTDPRRVRRRGPRGDRARGARVRGHVVRLLRPSSRSSPSGCSPSGGFTSGRYSPPPTRCPRASPTSTGW